MHGGACQLCAHSWHWGTSLQRTAMLAGQLAAAFTVWLVHRLVIGVRFSRLYAGGAIAGMNVACAVLDGRQEALLLLLAGASCIALQAKVLLAGFVALASATMAVLHHDECTHP